MNTATFTPAPSNRERTKHDVHQLIRPTRHHDYRQPHQRSHRRRSQAQAQTRAHSASPAPAAPVLAEALKSLLVDWFPVRDRLCDLRSKDDQTDREAEEVYQRLSELVDIADDIVAELVPDVAARIAVTGEILP